MKALLLLVALAAAAPAQVLQLAEMNTEQIKRLDHKHTVVIIPGGILEEHGPYLPSYTDGYVAERLSRDLAEAVAARPGWTAVLTPDVPLGHSGANVIGRKYSFPGSYTVRASTLREIYMDLADAFGQQGFEWIFIIHTHGQPVHHQVLEQAGDYFHDTYGGRMVPLLGLYEVYNATGSDALLTPEQVKLNGLNIHADIFETSAILFLRPDLVPTTYRSAPTLTAGNPDQLMSIAAAPDWPGYFGLVKDSSASLGVRDYANLLDKARIDMMKILDGADPHSFESYYTRMSSIPKIAANDERDRENDASLQKKHEQWLAAHAK